MTFLAELKRRNVLRAAVAYLAASWLVVQVADTVFPVYGLGTGALNALISALVIGFPPFLLFSWVFKITPEGFRRGRSRRSATGGADHGGNGLDRVIIVLLALALGYFAVDKFVLDPVRVAELVEKTAQQTRSEQFAKAYRDKSIAVLPFVNMSDDARNEYFSDGISEELINLLAKIRELRVISRTSAFYYKGKQIKLAQVAEDLNVANILEGSVRKNGNHVRITVQLNDARADTHLWSETYDRTLEDIFVIQDEIAAKVVEHLKVTLLETAPKVDRSDPEAYSIYLQARYQGRLSTNEGFDLSDALYRQALALDGNFAAAWDGLALNYINRAGAGLLPFEEGFALARDAAEKALAIDPGYALAYSRIGWIELYHDNDMAQAARRFQRALELDPANTSTIGNTASLLRSLGRLDEAIALEEYFTTRDPVNSSGHANLGTSYLAAGRWDAAIAAYETSLKLSPGRIGANYGIGTALLFKGETQAALTAMEQESSETFRLLGQAMAQYALGNAAASDAALAVLVRKYEREWAYNIAYVLAYRNEADQAFAWLNKALTFGDPGLPDIVVQPEFEKIHNDQRWLPFLRSVGKAPEQLANIEFHVTLPED